MRQTTLLLTGIPRFVNVVDLSYNLDLLFDTNDIGTFKIRDVSDYSGKRKIALDFSSSFEAFAAQARLDGYVYSLSNGQEYKLNAKVEKKNMALRRVSQWRSPSPVEGVESRYLDAIAILPTMSDGALEQAHAKLDAHLDLLKKQKLILQTQKEILKANKKLQKEYSKAGIDSLEEPTSSGYNPPHCDPSRSKSNPRDRQPSPVKTSETQPIQTKKEKLLYDSHEKEQKCKSQKKTKVCKRRSRSRKRSRSKNRRSSSKNRQSDSKNRRLNSINRRSSSKSRRSKSRDRRSCPRNRRPRSKDRWSSSYNRRRNSINSRSRSRSNNRWSRSRSKIRRSRSKYTRSRSREARKRWRSRSREVSPRVKAHSGIRFLQSPESSRNRSRPSRDRMYTRRRQFFGKDSVSRSPSSEPYPRKLTIIPGPLIDPHSIIVQRKITPVFDYFNHDTVTKYDYISNRAIRYRCEAEKDENVSKCIDLDTNTIDDTPMKVKEAYKYQSHNNIVIDIKYAPVNGPIDQVNVAETTVGINKIQEISKSNEDIVEEDNSVLEKPLVEIIPRICKDSSLNTDPISSYDEKDNLSDLISGMTGDTNSTVSSGYIQNKTELSIKEETNLNDDNLAWKEISTMATNIEDVKPVIDLANIPELIKTKEKNSSQQKYSKFLSNNSSIDVNVEPIVDLKKIPESIELNEELLSLLKPLVLVDNKDSNIDKVVKTVKHPEEKPEVVEIKEPLLPKRPKFVIIIRTLMKEMGASIRKVKHDFMKMSFQCKLKYVLRVMLREIVLGKDRMSKSEILRSFREKYPREQDDELARQLVEGIKARKYGNLGPSDDELSDNHAGDDLILMENEDEAIIVPDSDDESGTPQKTNEVSRREAWAEWTRARKLTPKEPSKPFAPNTMMPRVLIPYPTSMGPPPDKENTLEAKVENLENNDIVPEFTDTDVESLLKCMEKVEPGITDPREGTETPHVTGITIMTSLSELYSLKYGQKASTKEEKKIKIEHNSLTEEYINDDAQYYNPYKDESLGKY